MKTRSPYPSHAQKNIKRDIHGDLLAVRFRGNRVHNYSKLPQRISCGQSIGYSSAARCLPSQRAHGTSPGLANGARLSSVLDPRRPKRAHLFHPENQVFGVTRGRSGTQEPHIKGVPPRVVPSERSSRMKKLMLICLDRKSVV